MEKKYNFYGWETANISPTKNPYINNKLFKNPKELYDVLSEIWSKETCAPRMRKDWTKENKTLGYFVPLIAAFIPTLVILIIKNGWS